MVAAENQLSSLHKSYLTRTYAAEILWPMRRTHAAQILRHKRRTHAAELQEQNFDPMPL